MRKAIIQALILGIFFPFGAQAFLLKKFAGNFKELDTEWIESVGDSTRRFIQEALAPFDSGTIADHHVHLVGMGHGGTGAAIHPHFKSWWHPIKKLTFKAYLSASGISGASHVDSAYWNRLEILTRDFGGRARFGLLGFDKHYTGFGEPLLSHTEFYLPNEYMWSLYQTDTSRFFPVISIHPHREDALEVLDKWAEKGVRWVKWLPNAMGMDPSDAGLEPYYRAMKRNQMVLLTHAGEEQAVEAEEYQRLGNPLLFQKAMDAGVPVVMAHCASLGDCEDLDDPEGKRVSCFQLFSRLMDNKKYEGLLFGDLSAVTQFNRDSSVLAELMNRTEWHSRLINGSDYPLPGFNFLIRTKRFVKQGFLTDSERDMLNRIYKHNPLLFDFLLKRTLRVPGSGKGFSQSVFQANKRLPIFYTPPMTDAEPSGGE